FLNLLRLHSKQQVIQVKRAELVGVTHMFSVLHSSPLACGSSLLARGSQLVAFMLSAPRAARFGLALTLPGRTVLRRAARKEHRATPSPGPRSRRNTARPPGWLPIAARACFRRCRGSGSPPTRRTGVRFRAPAPGGFRGSATTGRRRATDAAAP